MLSDQEMRNRFGSAALEKFYFSSTSRDAWIVHKNAHNVTADAAGVRYAHKFEPKWTEARAKNGPTEVTYRKMYPPYDKDCLFPMPSFKPPPSVTTSGLSQKLPCSDYQQHFHEHPLAVRDMYKWDKNASSLFGENPVAFGYDNSTYGRGYVRHDLQKSPRQEQYVPFDTSRELENLKRREATEAASASALGDKKQTTPRPSPRPLSTTYQAFCESLLPTTVDNTPQETPRGRKPSNSWVNHVVDELGDFAHLPAVMGYRGSQEDLLAWGKHMAAMHLPPPKEPR